MESLSILQLSVSLASLCVWMFWWPDKCKDATSRLHFLSYFPFVLCVRDDHGFSPLHWACREGRSGVVDMLIMRGARINVMNRGDDTPLHLAASHGHRDIVAKVRFPKQLICWNALSLSLMCFCCSVLWWQLIQCKADPNTVNEHGNTPLHYACFWGHDEVAEVHHCTKTHTFHIPFWIPSVGEKPPSSGQKLLLQQDLLPLSAHS